MAGKVRFEGRPEIQEIHLAGDYAFCWNYLSVKMHPLDGSAPTHREGNVLSVFRKEPDGRWVLFRDANLLTAK
jgi:ketosteroid isomerase-like protein